jgi:hypothetical protein
MNIFITIDGSYKLGVYIFVLLFSIPEIGDSGIACIEGVTSTSAPGTKFAILWIFILLLYFELLCRGYIAPEILQDEKCACFIL